MHVCNDNNDAHILVLIGAQQALLHAHDVYVQ